MNLWTSSRLARRTDLNGNDYVDQDKEERGEDVPGHPKHTSRLGRGEGEENVPGYQTGDNAIRIHRHLRGEQTSSDSLAMSSTQKKLMFY